MPGDPHLKKFNHGNVHSAVLHLQDAANRYPGSDPRVSQRLNAAALRLAVQVLISDARDNQAAVDVLAEYIGALDDLIHSYEDDHDA